jgi:hypothetical protein
MPLTSTLPEHPATADPDEGRVAEIRVATPEAPAKDVPTCPDEGPAAEAHDPAPPGSQAESRPLHTPEEEAELMRIKDLPKEVGVMLLTVGALGFALPGVVGTPAVIAGGLVLWPKAFGKVENWFEQRFPKVHKQSLYQINRYLNDLESRYPDATRKR